MAPIIKGQELLDALDNINRPADLTNVVKHLALHGDKSLSTTFMNKTKSALEAGVRYGYIGKRNDKYFIPDVASADVAGDLDSEIKASTVKSSDNIPSDPNDGKLVTRQTGRRSSRRRRRSSSRSRSRSRSGRRSSRRRA
ncbi:uncharacterized protein [Musca autumnalis]|uniref:uncharacterized protein n=1 Tax=Musca autumnalis TaxID=221902 RepID=UPI003CEA1F63